MTTRGSKLDEFAEIKGDEVPLERKSHCLVLVWGDAKNGRAWPSAGLFTLLFKCVCIIEMTDHLSSYLI